MKHMSRTLTLLTAATVIIGFWLVVGMLGRSTGVLVSEIGRYGVESGFTLADSVQILPTLAIIVIVIPKVMLITLSLWFLSLQMIGRMKLFDYLSIVKDRL